MKISRTFLFFTQKYFIKYKELEELELSETVTNGDTGSILMATDKRQVELAYGHRLEDLDFCIDFIRYKIALPKKSDIPESLH